MFSLNRVSFITSYVYLRVIQLEKLHSTGHFDFCVYLRNMLNCGLVITLMQHDIFYYGGSDYQKCIGDISD